ncbi:MAG: adenylyltransferase/cytidyltransferase family protein [bacterium]|nr:adenylyltransferase/cytidyltransferase family protein [bacterium]
MTKLIKRQEVSQIKNKNLNKKIVCVNGCFDVIHVGHIRYLYAAKKIGDILVVALNDDESVKKIKGEQRPILPFQDRVEILSAFQMVDYIVGFHEKTAENILKELKSDIQAKGTDYTPDTVPERHLIGKYVKEIAIVGDPKDHSTKNIIKEIVKRYS